MSRMVHKAMYDQMVETKDKRIAELEEASVVSRRPHIVENLLRELGETKAENAKLREMFQNLEDEQKDETPHDVRACIDAHPDECCGSIDCNECKHFPHVPAFKDSNA